MMRTLAPGNVTARQLVERARISYRQLDYWCRTGLVDPIGEGEGSGSLRQFTPEEAARVEAIATLVRTGIRPSAAVEVLDRADVCPWCAGTGLAPVPEDDARW